MTKFSWHTDDRPHISTYLNGAPKKRYLVVDGIAVVGRCVMNYKPNRKGGHTHNHIYNVLYRSTFHHGPREVGADKPFYREVLLTSIERFRYTVSKGKLITKQMK